MDIPAGWDLQLDADGGASLSDPRARGPWSNRSLQIMPHAEPAGACAGEERVLPSATVCITASSGAGSHSSGTTLEARFTGFLLRFTHNVAEGAPATSEAELRAFALPILNSFRAHGVAEP